LNETLLWLLYCVSGGLAFTAVSRWRWHIAWAVVAGGLVTMIGWLLIFRFTEEERRPDWLKLDLSLNVTFGLIFAAFGAALGWWLLKRRANPD
jgi:hypothetical protein